MINLPINIKSKKFIIAIAISVVIAIVYFIMKRKKKTSVFFKEPKSASVHNMIERKYMKKPVDNKYSISLFINIKEWYNKFREWKHVFHIGSKIKEGEHITWNSIHNQSPGVWLTPKLNNLRVVFSNHSRDSFKNDHITHQYVDIENIPINEYFNLIINVEHTSLSIYLNGKFIRTLLLSEMPIFSCGNMYLNYNGGFNGHIKKLTYYEKILSLKEINKISKH